MTCINCVAQVTCMTCINCVIHVTCVTCINCVIQVTCVTCCCPCWRYINCVAQVTCMTCINCVAQVTCLTCCCPCWASTRSTCATTTTACRCWPSTSRSTSSTLSSSAMKRNPPARAAPWRPSSPTLCTRWVHACWVNSSVCWVLMHVHEQWGQGGPLFVHVVGCLGCLSPLAPWRLNCLVVRSSPHGSVVIPCRLEGGYAELSPLSTHKWAGMV